ncbi:MAG: 50S ribosomal protein L10 [Desulfobacterales bacterium]|uniref:Large ribosomal subunit protein uL10 n=1 Tax=Candidatus Desulfaltia bathyphila TaxID=2841697 RepID=A0A8J6TC06_9BACT|nr:50S ribosomal protein L10 [Candidatus Desulfaltia bathyphila]MBL7195987.1 50S ribosomal protein L10 [Desulfobacterales bacterium]MBL7207546.1 50S ribosomal protein L10 [Desulfobacterales bacterium]
MKIDEKKKIVEDIHKKFSESKVVILTDYKGLNVEKINELRGKLKESGVEYKVVKNTLLVRASEETDISLIKDSFKGPSAVALSCDDPVTPAKILTEFAEDHEALEIKIGIMNGKILDLSAIKKLSALPSREVLLSSLLSVMSGVPTAFVRALNDMPKRLLNVLQAVKEQKEAV